MSTVADASMLEALRVERNRFVAFAFAASDLVLEIGDDGAIAYAAGAGQEFFGVETAQLVGANLFELIAPDDAASLRPVLRSVAVGARSKPVAVRAVAADGGFHALCLRAYRLPESGKGLYVSVTRGVVETQTSPGIGSPAASNSGDMERERFAQSINRRLGEARASGKPLSLTMFSMDGIGSPTDDAGAQAEQHLLHEVTALLRQYSDAPTDVSQFGGHEFGIVHEPDAVYAKLAEEIEQLTKHMHHGVRNIAVHAKAVDLDGDLSEAESVRAIIYTLGKFADAGPEEFTLTSLSDSARSMLAETLEWSTRIKRTMGERRFFLAYQPIVGLADRKTHHYEALLRLPDAPAGVSPYKFVTMAEQLGSIAQCDLTVTEEAIRQMRTDWRDGESVAINVSGRSLVSAGFIDELTAQIDRHRELAHRLLFEVTESAKIVDLEGVNEALQALRRHGVRVCLDDFGAGAAAFDYLRTLNVDILKIDGSFVRNATTSKFSRAFIRSIASLCDGLGIETIAEMVEDEETTRVIHEAGVTHGQGYLFGKPEPIESYIKPKRNAAGA